MYATLLDLLDQSLMLPLSIIHAPFTHQLCKSSHLFRFTPFRVQVKCPSAFVGLALTVAAHKARHIALTACTVPSTPFLAHVPDISL